MKYISNFYFYLYTVPTYPIYDYKLNALLLSYPLLLFNGLGIEPKSFQLISQNIADVPN